MAPAMFSLMLEVQVRYLPVQEDKVNEVDRG